MVFRQQGLSVGGNKPFDSEELNADHARHYIPEMWFGRNHQPTWLERRPC